MAKMTFGSKWGRVKAVAPAKAAGGAAARSPEELVRQMKQEAKKGSDEDYRERSLALHGHTCARCGRSFEGANRKLLTVHHKDGNHFNNPADGSNWENLCVYCHEDVHSREVLGDYHGGGGGRDEGLAYADPGSGGRASSGLGTLGEKLAHLRLKK